jgi:hypothetical protein
MRTIAFVSPVTARRWAAPIALIVLWFAAHAALAQSLGWEGPTGVFVTPLAYTAASPAKGIGNPAVAYHFLAGGPVIGDHSTVSVTEGFAKRFEFGFTEVIHAAGAYGSEGKYTDSTGAFDPPSNLWGDFSIVHVKANLLPENFHKNNWVPAVSAGAIYRFNDQFGADLNNYLTGGDTTADQRTNNEDIYVVATKIVTQTKPIPILLSAGLRGTNSSLWGLGGNSPGFEGKVFGAAALIFTGPKKSTIIIGASISTRTSSRKIPSGSRTASSMFPPPRSLRRASFPLPSASSTSTSAFCTRATTSPAHWFRMRLISTICTSMPAHGRPSVSRMPSERISPIRPVAAAASRMPETGSKSFASESAAGLLFHFLCFLIFTNVRRGLKQTHGVFIQPPVAHRRPLPEPAPWVYAMNMHRCR